MTYPAYAPPPVDYDNWNAMVDRINGFLAGGTYRVPYDFLITYAAGIYYASNAFQIVFSGASFLDVIELCLATGRTIALDSDTTFEVNEQAGLILTGYSNFTLYGSKSSVIKYTYVGVAQQLFKVTDGSDIVVSGITFDMDKASYGGAGHPAAGCGWIAKVGDGATTATNVTFRDCNFINSPDCGVVLDKAVNTTFDNCYFDNIDEHPFYTSANTDGLTIYRCCFLNWAKWIRGYLKFTQSKNTFVNDCYFEPNEDGLGFPDTGGAGSPGATAFMCDRCTDLYVDGAICIGSGAGVELRPVIDQVTANNIFFSNLKVYNWSNASNDATSWSTQDETHVSSLRDSYFEGVGVVFPLFTENLTIVDPPVRCYPCADHSTLENIRFVWVSAAQNFIVLNLSTYTDITVKSCKFFGYHLQGIDAHSTVDSKIIDCYFDQGFSSWGIQGGGTRLSIEGNTFANVTTSGTASIYIAAGSEIKVIGNVLGDTITTNIDTSKLLVARDNINFEVSILKEPTLYHHTVAVDLFYYSSGTTHTNFGSDDGMGFYLPPNTHAGPPIAGTTYTIVAMATFTAGNDNLVNIHMDAGASVYFEGTKTVIVAQVFSNDDYATKRGDSMTFVATGNGDWVVTDVVGNWSLA